MSLNAEWNKLASQYFTVSEQINPVFELLESHYEESHRYYHGFSHIQALFDKATQLQINWLAPDLVAFAIWFHDVIYDATKTDNEQKSAELAVEVLSKNTTLDQDQIKYIDQLILATAKHELILDNADFRNFLDLDLSILGESWSVYQAYAESIRKEYQHVPWPMYQAGRKQILERFLTRASIYYSNFFRDMLEEKARENIRREIEEVLS